MKPALRLRAIHSLRFLIDAFRSRRPAIEPFVGELAEFIAASIVEGQNLVTAKICLEATGLLPDDRALPILEIAMGSRNSWLQETAFRACRNLPRLEPALRASICDYVSRLPIPQFWTGYAALRFSLSLSDALKDVLAVARRRYLDLWSSAIAAPAALLTAPFVTVVCLFSAASINLTSRTPLLPFSIFPSPQEVTRTLMALLLGFGGFALLAQTAGWPSVNLLPPNFDLLRLQVSLWPLDNVPFVYVGLLYVVLALAMMDWLWLSSAWNWCKAIVQGRARPDWEVIVVLPSIALVGAVTIWGVIKLHLEWLVFGVGVFGFAATLAFSASSIWKRLRHYWDDRAYSCEIALTPRMLRGDIAHAMCTLITAEWRMKFVQRLEQENVHAIGNWPDDFRLAVGDDSAIIELARLEERWLKLDR